MRRYNLEKNHSICRVEEEKIAYKTKLCLIGCNILNVFVSVFDRDALYYLDYSVEIICVQGLDRTTDQGYDLIMIRGCTIQRVGQDPS